MNEQGEDLGVQARQAVSESVSRLLVEQPFYGYFLNAFDFYRADTETETMGVGGRRGRIRCTYNAGFVLALSEKERQAVLVHEVLHAVHRHLTRLGPRDQRLFNIACDMAINPKIPDLPEGALFPPKNLVGANAERIYEKLNPRIFGETLDDHDIWTSSGDMPWEVEGAIERAVRSSYNRVQGRVPSDVASRVHWWLSRPQISWRQMLRNFVGLHAPVERMTTSSRRNRRMDLFGIPGRRRRYCPHVAVVVDTSGSISQANLNLFFSEVEGLALEVALMLLLFNTEVYRICPYRRGDFVRIGERIWSGGTDFFPVFDCLEQGAPAVDGSTLSEPVDCVVLLTDGYAEYPESSHLPVLWVLSPYHNDELPPFGRVAVLEERQG